MKKSEQKRGRGVDKQRLPPFLAKVEHFVDRSIPWLLVVLTVLIILEFTVSLEHYEPWPLIADAIVVSFFIVDLGFKWYHAKHLKQFFRLYWIDILAVFPFYLLFRLGILAQELIIAGERIGEAQKVTHEALLLKETSLLREAELSKGARLTARIIRFAQRMLRGWKIAYRTIWQVSDRHR